MKRIITLALVALFTLGMGSMASAVDINMSGAYQTGFQWTDNLNFLDTEEDGFSEDDFFAYQRIRFYWEAVASENLRMVFGIQSDIRHGATANDVSNLGADSNVGLTKEDAYLEFVWPNTALRFRTGFWYLEPPANFGSPIWNDDVAGVSASYAFNDMVSLVTFWARLWDRSNGGELEDGDEGSDEIDAFGAILPVSGDGFTLTPYVIYAAHGRNASGGQATHFVTGLTPMNATNNLDDDLDIWWAGAQFSLDMFDPFVFYADLIYGTVDAEDEQNDRSGWWFDVAVDYRMDMVTPRLFFAYGSGEDEDENDGSERFPTLGVGADSCGCGITTFGLDGSRGTWGAADARLIQEGYGFWVVGLSLMDFSFVENLSHTFTVAYGQGTNDSDLIKDARQGSAGWIANRYVVAGRGDSYAGYNGFMTDEDSFWEINFDHTYQMYENLTAILELGYISPSLDEDVWGNVDEEAASKAAFILRYSF